MILIHFLFLIFRLPRKSNFKADVDFVTSKVFKCKSLPGFPLHTDTLYFQVYVKDFAKNKSNVIITGDPVYYTCR